MATGDRGWGEALLPQAATVVLATPKSVGDTRGDAVKLLGGGAADAGCWSPAVTLLRKSTSKHEKTSRVTSRWEQVHGARPSGLAMSYDRCPMGRAASSSGLVCAGCALSARADAPLRTACPPRLTGVRAHARKLRAARELRWARA